MKVLKFLFKLLYKAVLGVVAITAIIAAIIGFCWLIKPYADTVYKIELWLLGGLFLATVSITGHEFYKLLHEREEY